MLAEQKNIANIIEAIVQLVIKFGQINEIILYGSRAKGTYMERSDIDIALVGENINIIELMDEIDQIDTLLKIDLVDIKNCKNERLKSEVKENGITLYRKV